MPLMYTICRSCGEVIERESDHKPDCKRFELEAPTEHQATPASFEVVEVFEPNGPAPDVILMECRAGRTHYFVNGVEMSNAEVVAFIQGQTDAAMERTKMEFKVI